MRQEIQATVSLTFDADANLAANELPDAILAELGRLIDTGPLNRPVELVGARLVEPVREEAEIYGNG